MAEGHEKFVYVGSCIELDGDLIDWVRGRQRDIGGPKPDDLDFEDFAKLVPASQFQHEGLNDDWHVRFYASSAPSGVPLLYYAHSGIEWVFAPRSSGFDPGMEAEIITAKLDAEYATPNRVKTMIDSAAFRRWFGDSVVVDEDGEPLVVYHGTDADDFKSFRAEALPRGGRKGRLLGEGFYFTSDPDQAARWGRRVIAAYLRIENPRTQRGGLLVPASSDQDGTIAAGAPGTRDGEVWFVVKSPYQIKSATDNDGSFDPDDDHFTSNGRTFIPPQKVADEAAYGLYLRSQMPKSNRCCTPVGLARAKQLKNREPLSIDTLKRMRSYFQRHEVDKRGRNWGVDSKGYQAWLLWGGDSGRDWCNRTLDHLDEG